MFRPVLVVLVAMALASGGEPVVAQKNRAPAPTEVTVTQTSKGVSVVWGTVRGAMYRITRSMDPKAPGADLTAPIAGASFIDQTASMGTTYYYQVIAVYPDGTLGAAPPVSVTPQAPTTLTMLNPVGGGGATIQPKSSSGLATRYTTTPPATPPPPPPPAVLTGITVTGTTTASALVSWPAVPGATSYTVTRTTPVTSAAPMAYPGLPGPAWTDLGPNNVGFYLGGTYQYQVTALLGDGSTISGTASWLRPSPTCAAPPANQTMLAVLNPLTNSQFTARGPYPGGAVYTFTGNPNQVIGYRVERSVQGSNAWTLVGTSCAGNPGRSSYNGPAASAAPAVFADDIGGIVANTTYLYRFTGLAANGDAGSGTLTWTAPDVGILRWIAITPGVTNITVQWRYEPPVSGTAPTAPYHVFALNYGKGMTQSMNAGPGNCATYVGCSMTVATPPKGTMSFRIIANWIYTKQTYQGNVPITMGTVTADTLIKFP